MSGIQCAILGTAARDCTYSQWSRSCMRACHRAMDGGHRPAFVWIEAMRFVDTQGHTWIVRDVALLPERTLVEPGHADAVERYFTNAAGEKRLYHFLGNESRSPRSEQMERQLRAAQLFTAQRQSDPNLSKV